MKVVESEIRMTLGQKVWIKWVETRKDAHKFWHEPFDLIFKMVIYSRKKDTCTKRYGRSSGTFDFIDVRDLFSVFFWRMQVSRI